MTLCLLQGGVPIRDLKCACRECPCMGGQRADGICNKRLLTTRTAKLVI